MAFTSINNYFEKLVFDVIQEKLYETELDNNEDFLADIACVALNQLPSRYVRHNVDMVFYMTAKEREQNQVLVEDAVIMAINYVNKHRHNERPKTINQ
jgi:competence protein ComFB